MPGVRTPGTGQCSWRPLSVLPLQTVLSDAPIESSVDADGIDSTICDNSNTSQPEGIPEDSSANRSGDFPHVGESTRYFGDYELQEEIASGGMGVVYRARQMRLNRIVALKMIRAGKFSSWTEIKRLRAEAEAAAQLDHPNIVPVFEVGEQDGLHYFTMAFVDGQTLSEKLSQGPLPVQEAAELIHRVAKAIAYAHDAGVIHRDIKPGNILIDKAGQPRVGDFGLAKQVTLESDLTTTGQILGTPSYMPPEQALGHLDEVNRTSDIYALGAVLYATLSGRPPFQAASSIETLRQVVDQQPVAPRLLNPSVPRDLETICLKCLEKKASARYSTAHELAADLNRYLCGHPIAARPISRMERHWRWLRRRPDLLFAVLALSTLFGIGITLAFVQQQRHEHMQEQVRTEGLIHSIEAAEFRELPRLISDLSQFSDREQTLHELTRRATTSATRENRLRIDLTIGLLSAKLEPGTIESWLSLSLQELLIVKQLTLPLRPQLLHQLRDTMNTDTPDNQSRQRQLRAAGLLVTEVVPDETPNLPVTTSDSSASNGDFSLPPWENTAETLLQVVYENPREFDAALLLFQSAAADLYEPLKRKVETRSISDQQRHLAIALMCELMRNTPRAIAELACLIDADALPLLRRYVDGMNSSIIPALMAELQRPAISGAVSGELLPVESQKKLATELVESQANDVRRQAMAAAWLFRLGKSEFVWPLLKKQPDASLRYALIDRIRLVGGDIGPVLSQLKLVASEPLPETPTSVTDQYTELHTLLLLAGDLATQMQDAQRTSAIQVIAGLLETHPDPGVHSSCEWALKQLGAISKVHEIRDRLGAAPLVENRNWYITRSGATMAVIRGPVTFQMGADWTDPDRLANDSVNPVTGEVTRSDEERYMQRAIPRDFAIGLKEVSLAEFLLCEKDFHEKINQFMSPTVDYPANKVNWYLAARYCNWLSEHEGIDASEWCFIPDSEGRYGEGLTLAANYLQRRGYRMPTEAEWEYACRAGTTTPRFFGHCRELLPQYVWYAENSKEQALLVPGTLKPNDLGLFDVFGNVIEWCIDPYKNRPVEIGGVVPDVERDLTANAEAWRVLRGGHLYADEPNIRATDLWTFRPLTSDGHYGLRLARTLKVYELP